MGKGVEKAVENVNTIIAPALLVRHPPACVPRPSPPLPPARRAVGTCLACVAC